MDLYRRIDGHDQKNRASCALSDSLVRKYQEAVDIQEALRRDNLQDKENVNNASQFLAPNPQPLPRSLDTHNPLSSLTNEVFQDLMRTKMEVERDKVASEKRRYMMFLIEKKASGVITDEEFELFKNM